MAQRERRVHQAILRILGKKGIKTILKAEGDLQLLSQPSTWSRVFLVAGLRVLWRVDAHIAIREDLISNGVPQRTSLEFSDTE